MKPIKMENEEELLKEIRVNNCREILACEVNVSVGERMKLKKPAQLQQFQQFITAQKDRQEGLMEAVRVIDERLDDLQSKR